MDETVFTDFHGVANTARETKKYISISPIRLVELDDAITQLRAELAALRAERQWVRCEDKLPDTSETGWSEYVKLAYKVIGCEYHGMQTVSRYHLNIDTQEFEWEYPRRNLTGWGYEAVAWQPLGPGPEA